MSDKEPLMTLKTKADGKGDVARTDEVLHTSDAPVVQDGLPLLGLFAVGFGVLGLFTFAPLFSPLALVLGLIALFIGQLGWGLAGILLAIVGMVTSPVLMTLFGLGALLSWLGLPF